MAAWSDRVASDTVTEGFGFPFLARAESGDTVGGGPLSGGAFAESDGPALAGTGTGRLREDEKESPADGSVFIGSAAADASVLGSAGAGCVRGGADCTCCASRSGRDDDAASHDRGSANMASADDTTDRRAVGPSVKESDFS